MNVAWKVAFVAETGLTLLLGILVLGLFRRFTLALESVERAHAADPHGVRMGLPIGSVLPRLQVQFLPGTQPVALLDEVRSASWALVSVSEDCDVCHKLVEAARNGGWHSPDTLVLLWARGASSVPTNLPGNVRPAIEATESVRDALRSDVYPNAFVFGDDGEVLDQFIPTTLEEISKAMDRLGTSVHLN